jgi:hypothetical protein
MVGLVVFFCRRDNGNEGGMTVEWQLATIFHLVILYHGRCDWAICCVSNHKLTVTCPMKRQRGIRRWLDRWGYSVGPPCVDMWRRPSVLVPCSWCVACFYTHQLRKRTDILGEIGIPVDTVKFAGNFPPSLDRSPAYLIHSAPHSQERIVPRTGIKTASLGEAS